MSRNSKRTRTTSIKEKTTTIVILACIVLATVLAVWECCKIAKTGLDLVMYNLSTQSYNESLKTDASTEAQQEDNEKRQAIYNSEDSVIRIFSNLPFIPKLVIWILSMFTILMVPTFEVLYVKDVMVPIKKTKKGKRLARARKVVSC